MSERRVKVSLAALCLTLMAGVAHAETAPETAAVKAAVAAVNGKTTPTNDPIRPGAGTSLLAQIHSHDLAAFEAESRAPAAPSPRLTAEVMAALDALDPAAPAVNGAYASGPAAAAATPAAPAGSDAPAVTGDDSRAGTSILDLNPLTRLSGVATGLAAGIRLPLPDDATLSQDAAAAIVRAFRAPPGTADQAASDAADTASTGDPALDERISLARTVFKVDGTDPLIRHLVATQMMKIIIAEVAKHIEFSKLSETDKYRLAAIAASAQSELEEKILNLNARVEANYLSKSDLTLLIVAYDNDAQRKQTGLRLADTGKADRDAALDITMAQVQIVKSFESGQ